MSRTNHPLLKKYPYIPYTNNQKKIHDVFCFLQIGCRTILMFNDLSIKDKFSLKIRRLQRGLINRENFQLIFSDSGCEWFPVAKKSAAQISASASSSSKIVGLIPISMPKEESANCKSFQDFSAFTTKTL